MTGYLYHPAEFCPRGHDLREPGSYYERSDGRRSCKVCRRASITAWRAANPGGVARSGPRLPEETRAKIAAALKAHHAARGGDAK